MADRQRGWQIAIALALALLWLALALPHIATRYSYDWDSSQYERGVAQFDIARHQPQPPGYPLWILALKILTPLVGRVNAAQVILAMLFTIAGLIAFFALARDTLGPRAAFAATAMLAFSPVVMLYAITPETYSVDLFATCTIAWCAARLWRGETRWASLAFALAAITAGFRQSGATFLLLLLFVAAWRARRVTIGLITGATCALAWYIPTAQLTGGFTTLAVLDRTQLMTVLRTTSVFFGAPVSVHVHMLLDACLFFALALIPAALVLVPRRRPVAPSPARPLFFLLWLGPNLAFITLFHCGRPGYILLSLPPLILLAAWLASPLPDRPHWTLAIAALGLAAGYFPYERFINPAVPTAVYQLLKASPRMPGLLESSQRQIRTLIDNLPGHPEEKLVFCLLERTEAPNLRTMTYEYPDVQWADGDDLRVPPPARTIAWLCDGAGLPPTIRARYTQAQRVAGNALFSLWTAAAQP